MLKIDRFVAPWEPSPLNKELHKFVDGFAVFVVDAVSPRDLHADRTAPTVPNQVLVGVGLLSKDHKDSWRGGDRFNFEGAVNPGTQFSLAVELLESAVPGDHTVAKRLPTRD